VSALAPGLVLNETYRLERRIAEGGMGEVWAAAHLRLPKHVAIKFIALRSLEEGARARFEREAAIAARLEHPNIAQVFDFHELPDGRAYLVMELLRGRTLRQALKEGPLAREQVVPILREIVSGLSAAHEAGVVHRDLKPDNIFLVGESASDWHVKLLDFGIAKRSGVASDLTGALATLGTPGYMAPEQAEGGARELDARADQFALGIVAYEVVSHRRAFPGAPFESIVAVLRDPPPRLLDAVPDAPATWAKAIERALSRSPDQRFPNVRAFLEAFEHGGPAETATRAERVRAAAALEAPAADLEAPGPSPTLDARATRFFRVALGLTLTAIALGTVTGFAMFYARLEPTSAARESPSSRSFETDASVAPIDESDAARESELEASRETEPPPARPRPLESTPRPERGATPATAEQAQLIRQAREALAAGRLDEAMRLGRRAERLGATEAGSEVLAESYCRLGDLGMYNASLASLGPAARRRVTEACRRQAQ
jgi:eukaryotic-like serine/threonine-protein kinase